MRSWGIILVAIGAMLSGAVLHALAGVQAFRSVAEFLVVVTSSTGIMVLALLGAAYFLEWSRRRAWGKADRLARWEMKRRYGMVPDGKGGWRRPHDGDGSS